MLVIRFKKIGRKHQKTFRLIVTERKSSPKIGDPVEQLGWWDPRFKKGAFKHDRINHWVSKGAQLSDSVRRVLVKQERGVVNSLRSE